MVGFASSNYSSAPVATKFNATFWKQRRNHRSTRMLLDSSGLGKDSFLVIHKISGKDTSLAYCTQKIAKWRSGSAPQWWSSSRVTRCSSASDICQIWSFSGFSEVLAIHLSRSIALNVGHYADVEKFKYLATSALFRGTHEGLLKTRSSGWVHIHTAFREGGWEPGSNIAGNPINVT